MTVEELFDEVGFRTCGTRNAVVRGVETDLPNIRLLVDLVVVADGDVDHAVVLAVVADGSSKASSPKSEH